MTPPTPPPDDDAQEAARRLISFIQQRTPTRPALIHGIDEVTRAILVQENRDFVTEKLQTMTPEDVDTMAVLAAHLSQARGDKK